MKKVLIFVSIGLIAIFIILQLVPKGHDKTNPPLTGEPAWDSSQTRELTSRACFDCHSNETVWPWYSYIAPVSWLVQQDVVEGRSRLNFSEWGSGRYDEPWEIVEVFENGAMPPVYYLPLHKDARLTQDERKNLISGFQATFVR